MSTQEKSGWFERPSLKRTSPDRRARNFYRSAASDGKAIGGVPLDSSEAVVVAAVRMAYKVAEAQIERSGRLARRLREAGDRAVGPQSDRQALDATERLVFNAMMALLGWIEGAASDSGNPLKRLAVAQYRLLGSMLGLTPSQPPESRAAGASEPDARRAEPSTSGPSAPRGEERPRFPVRIQHMGDEKRPVRVCAWEYAGDLGPPVTIPVKFYLAERPSAEPLESKIVIAGRRSVTLQLKTSGSLPAGRWSGALCDGQGMQVGYIEIML